MNRVLALYVRFDVVNTSIAMIISSRYGGWELRFGEPVSLSSSMSVPPYLNSYQKVTKIIRGLDYYVILVSNLTDD